LRSDHDQPSAVPQETAREGSRQGRPLPVVGRGGVVPYIATWSAETKPDVTVIERTQFSIAFADETVADRDRDGLLWTRTTVCPRQGRPQFAVIHSLRQRRAMRRLLCQVCAQPADYTEEDLLWLLPDYYQEAAGWPEDFDLAEPPICQSCVPIAIRLCPALRKGHLAVRARSAPVSGVKGLVYRAGRPSPVLIRQDLVRRDNPAIHWTVAEQLLRALRDCTRVDLKDLPGCRS
jgi:hypothetical protein